MNFQFHRLKHGVTIEIENMSDAAYLQIRRLLMNGTALPTDHVMARVGLVTVTGPAEVVAKASNVLRASEGHEPAGLEILEAGRDELRK